MRPVARPRPRGQAHCHALAREDAGAPLKRQWSYLAGSTTLKKRRARSISLFTSGETAADWTPSVTVSRNQFVDFRRPFAAGRIVREFRRLLIRPSLQDGSDQSPLIFDLIPPDEERRVALHHVQQKRLVSGRQTRAERRPVTEIHVHGG